MSQMTSKDPELLKLEQAHPGWHCWRSSTERPWAATTRGTSPGGGTTVDGDTPADLDKAIKAAEKHWAWVTAA